MIADFLLSMLDQKLIVVVESLQLASDIQLHLETHRTTGLKTLSLRKRGLYFHHPPCIDIIVSIALPLIEPSGLR